MSPQSVSAGMARRSESLRAIRILAPAFDGVLGVASLQWHPTARSMREERCIHHLLDLEAVVEVGKRRLAVHDRIDERPRRDGRLEG